jgi:signal transduction histidine kinase
MMVAWPHRDREQILRWVDWLIALALAADVVIEATVGPGVAEADRAATAAFGLLLVVPVAVRRRWPAEALVVSSAALLLQEPFAGQVTNLVSGSFLLAPVLLSYGVGAWLGLHRSIVAIGVSSALWVADAVVESFVTHTAAIGGVAGLAQLLVLPLWAPWVVGRFIRSQRQRADAFHQLAAQTAAEQREREREAVARERLSIGRELQDIIAHDVSVMVIQAAAARRLMAAEPGPARESILAVETTGREALTEMRRLLGLLRKDDDPRALTPQPGLDQLEDLLASLRASGLDCVVKTDGSPVPLTPGINLVSYRVIEAALRAAAAAGSRTATTRVRYAAGDLELAVGGDRAPAALASNLGGIGERVRLYGGRLELGTEAGVDAWLRCRLPLSRTVVA